MSVKLTKSLLVYGVLIGFSQSILIFLLPAYTKVLSTETYGVFELIFSIFRLMSLIGIVQFDSALSRYYYEAKSDIERNNYIITAFLTVLFFSIIVGLIGYSLSSFLSELFFSTDNYTGAFEVISLTIPIVNLFNLLLIVSRFDGKPFLFGTATILQGVITIILTIYFLSDFNSALNGIFWANFIGFLIGLLVMLVYYRRILISKFNKSQLIKFFRYSIPLFPADLGSWINNHISKFLMILYLSKGQLGVFTAAIKVASILKFGDYVFRMAWTPFYLKELEKKDHKQLFISIFNKVLLVFGLGMIIFHYVKIPLSKLLFSNSSFYEANSYISPLAFCVVITILVQIVGMGPIIMKKTIYNTYNFLISISVFFIAFFILTPQFGINGVVFSQILSSIALLISSWYYSNKLYPINFNKKYATLFIVMILIIIYYF